MHTPFLALPKKLLFCRLRRHGYRSRPALATRQLSVRCQAVLTSFSVRPARSGFAAFGALAASYAQPCRNVRLDARVVADRVAVAFWYGCLFAKRHLAAGVGGRQHDRLPCASVAGGLRDIRGLAWRRVLRRCSTTARLRIQTRSSMHSWCQPITCIVQGACKRNECVLKRNKALYVQLLKYLKKGS